MKLLEESGHRTVPEFQYQPPSETEAADLALAQEPAPSIPEPSAIVPEAPKPMNEASADA